MLLFTLEIWQIMAMEFSAAELLLKGIRLKRGGGACQIQVRNKNLDLISSQKNG